MKTNLTLVFNSLLLPHCLTWEFVSLCLTWLWRSQTAASGKWPWWRESWTFVLWSWSSAGTRAELRSDPGGSWGTREADKRVQAHNKKLISVCVFSRHCDNRWNFPNSLADEQQVDLSRIDQVDVRQSIHSLQTRMDPTVQLHHNTHSCDSVHQLYCLQLTWQTKHKWCYHDFSPLELQDDAGAPHLLSCSSGHRHRIITLTCKWHPPTSMF